MTTIITMIMKSRQLYISILILLSSAVCRSYVLKPGVWQWNGHPIAYERVTAVEDTGNNNDDDVAPPLLLLNGFGVGSFHQHKLVQELMRNDDHCSRTIYCIDYLGQGKSWPEDCQDGSSESERGLRYCGETWTNQIVQFIDEVIRNNEDDRHQKIHIAGNSVGGHLAVCIAAMRPDLVESLCLMNPTPVWGLDLPGWSGHLPAPLLPRYIGRYLFDRIRDLGTIESFLKQVYVNPSAFDERLMRQIRACTDGDGGHAAFASILWSPPVSVPIRKTDWNGVEVEEEAQFDDCLRALECDVLLLFGAEDPWCTRAFGKRMLRDLAERHPPNEHLQRYCELSNVGHCPNHEAPIAVANLLSRWLDPAEGSRAVNELHLANEEAVQEAWGQTILSERKEEEIPLSFLDRLAITFV